MRCPVSAASLGLFALVILSSACSRKAPEGVERLAILPVENLSGDAALDRVAGAVQQVLTAQIAGDANVHAIPVGSLANAYTARAGRVVHGYLTARGGALRLAMTVEDLTTHKVVAAPEASGEIPRQLVVIDTVARRLAPGARPFSTNDFHALHFYTEGTQNSDIALLEKAIAADPNFGLAYVAVASLLVNQGHRQPAQDVLRRGLERGAEMAPSERAQLKFADATMKQDPGARAAAAAELAGTLPSDAAAAASAGQIAMLARQYRSAVEWYGRALKLEPQNAELWNQLGYAEAYNRNLEGASSALLEYGRRTPGNPNGFDSLGEVHYLLGDFAGAEKYFLEAARMNPKFLDGAPVWKAAHARLMTGDIAGADKIANSYFELLAKQNDPLVEYRRVYWDYEAGRHSRALEGTPSGPAAAFLHIQRAIWLLEADDSAKAREEVKRAIAGSPNQQARSLALIGAFLTQPPASAAEWKSRADKAFPGGGEDPLPRLATAYALVLGRHFGAAVPLLTQAVNTTSPLTNGALQFLLGWALVESGKAADAAPHLATYPVPQTGIDIFGVLAIPRIFRLQAAVLEQEGKPAEAARRMEIFRKLGGGS